MTSVINYYEIYHIFCSSEPTVILSYGVNTSATNISVRKAVMECFEEIRIRQMNKEQFLKKSKFLVMYFKMLTELRLQIEHHLLRVTLIDETFIKSFSNILLTLHTKEYSKDVLLNIIKMCQYVLFLPEVANLNTTLLNVILFFLFIPWLKEMGPMSQHTQEASLCIFKQTEQYKLFQGK